MVEMLHIDSAQRECCKSVHCTHTLHQPDAREASVQNKRELFFHRQQQCKIFFLFFFYVKSSTILVNFFKAKNKKTAIGDYFLRDNIIIWGRVVAREKLASSWKSESEQQQPDSLGGGGSRRCFSVPSAILLLIWQVHRWYTRIIITTTFTIDFSSWYIFSIYLDYF